MAVIEPEKHAPGSSNGKWLVLLSIGLGTFLGALDGSVVNTILPVIRQTFQADIASIEWVVVIYLLVVSGLLLTFGRIGDLYGHKRLYLLGLGIFTGASALCGLAGSAAQLVAFRGLQSLGAAMQMSNSPAILTKNFPAERRGQALGLQATMTYLGLTVGPVLGGWLAHAFGWNWVFYINLPVGALAILVGWRFIPREEKGKAPERFDLAGAALFTTGLVALLFALNQGHSLGWGSPLILGLLLGSVLLLAGFVFWERRVSAPMLDLALFRKRVFSAAVSSAVLNYIALFFLIFLMPFYLIQGRGLNAAEAGLMLTAQPLAMVVAAPISGTLSDRIGSRLPAVVGMAILAAALFWLSRLTPQSPWLQVSLGLALSGLGTGIFISPNNSALMGSAPRTRQGIAAGILATARNLGMVLGIGFAGAILNTVMGETVSERLFPAVSTGLLVAAGIALLASVVASARGEEYKGTYPDGHGPKKTEMEKEFRREQG